MTVIVSVASKEYAPGPINLSLTIPANTKRVVMTLTRESWPSGPVGSISIKYPDGSDATSSTYVGGTLTGYTGQVVTKQSLSLDGPSIDGVQQNLPQGQYPIAIDVLQTLTTSVLAERF
jgi:hypothetical protein